MSDTDDINGKEEEEQGLEEKGEGMKRRRASDHHNKANSRRSSLLTCHRSQAPLIPLSLRPQPRHLLSNLNCPSLLAMVTTQ